MAKRTKEPKMPPLGGEEDDRPKGLKKDEEVWKKRLVASKKFQAQYSAGWEENRRLIFNESASQKDSSGTGTPPWAGGGVNSVAYGWGLYEGLETAIYVKNPDVIASARDYSQQPIASRITSICKYDFDQMNVKDVGNLCLLDTFICGYGAVIEAVETYHRSNEKGERTGYVSGQEFEVRRIAPLDILFAKASRRLDLSDCPYLFTAWYPTIEDLRADPNITDLPEDIEDFPECTEYTRAADVPDDGTGTRQSSGLTGATGGEKDPAFKTVCVWEVYDKVNHEVLYLTDNKHYIIGRAPWPVNLRFKCRDLFPHTLLYSHPVPGRFYPRPEAELIAPQLRELNVTERLISEDSRTKFRKWITLQGILTEDQKAKITDTSVANAMLFVDTAKLQDVLGITQLPPDQIDLRNLVVPIEDIAPKKDLFTRYQMLEGEIQHIVGYGPASRQGLPSTRSAREAMMINQRQDARMEKRKDRIADFYRYMAMKHIRFLQKYMSVERYAKILPKTGQLQDWVKYGREEIQGDFEFDVVTGSSVPKSTEVRKASELQLFQAISPVLMQAGLPLRPAFERLAEFYDWDGVDQLFANVKEKAKQALAGLVGFNKGQVPPEALLNSIAQLLMAELSPAEFAMFKKQMEGGGGAQGQLPASGQANTPRGDSTPLRTTAGVP